LCRIFFALVGWTRGCRFGANKTTRLSLEPFVMPNQRAWLLILGFCILGTVGHTMMNWVSLGERPIGRAMDCLFAGCVGGRRTSYWLLAFGFLGGWVGEADSH
jgi:hypothetical protein